MKGLGVWLLRGAYGLFLALYFYAAGAYGLTRERHIIYFEWALGFTLVLWLVGHIFQGRLPRVGKWPWIVSGLVLSFGWFVTGMAVLDDLITYGDYPLLEDWFPSTLLLNWSTRDAALSTQAMWRTTVLLGGMLMAIDFWRDNTRSRALVSTIILCSSGMVIFFFLQRIVGPPFILMSEHGEVVLSFATYRYHANAGAYLNMAWPIAASVAVFAMVRQSTAWPFWFIPFVATFIATFLNVSKAGNVLAGVGVVIFLAVIWRFVFREIRRSNIQIRRSRILVTLVPVVIIAASIPFALPKKRWANYKDSFTEPGARLDAYALFLKMLPDSGFPGFGPGTFQKYYGPYLNESPLLRHQPYWAAHEDYIQTLVEWGYVGTVFWSLVLIPPFILLLRASLKKSTRAPNEFEGYRIGPIDHAIAFFKTIPTPREPILAAGASTAATLTALHATLDFPMQILSLQFDFVILLALGWSYLPKETPETQD